jgi:kumamolisin
VRKPRVRSQRSVADAPGLAAREDRDRLVVVSLYLKDPAEPRHAPGSARELRTLARPATRAGLRIQRQSQYVKAAQAIVTFASRHKLAVIDISFAKRRVRLLGSIRQHAKVFAGSKTASNFDSRKLRVPRQLKPWILGILGLDDRPKLPVRPQPFVVPAPNAEAEPGLWPRDIARLYGIDAPRRGAGECIAIIAPHGGYLPDDLALAAKAMGTTFPQVIDVSVDNGRNRFAGGTIQDQEVALDLQVIGAIAPAAKIAVYFTDASEQGLADAVLAAVHDSLNAPSVISISWGVGENHWAQFALDVMNGALADAVRLGVTVVAAAGDMLATNGEDDDLVHVNYPASSPHVLGCGGTHISLSAAGDTIDDEMIWKSAPFGTGGGVSELFDVPDYQNNAAVPPSFSTAKRGRGVPDVAAAAAFDPGYRIFVNKQRIVQGGTSAVAPLWAALVALVNAERGTPLGFLNPALYADEKLCRPIETGDNKAGPLGYSAGHGWSACGGLGAPIGPALLRKFTGVA